MDHTRLLNIDANPREIIGRLQDILSERAIDRLEEALDENVRDLLKLGEDHLVFAQGLDDEWRQEISRLYYAAYNVVRAVHLHHSGHYAKHVGDHKKVSDLPPDFPDAERFANQLGTLREDRNLADYDQTADGSDLILSVSEAEDLVAEFINTARTYLTDRDLEL